MTDIPDTAIVIGTVVALGYFVVVPLGWILYHSLIHYLTSQKI